MQITLSSPTHLRITWPLYPSDIDAEIRRRLATVPAIEAGRGRVAWAPVIQLQRLIELYPKASIQYDAICAADDIAMAFYTLLAESGAHFGVDLFGNVTVTGDNVSPLLEQLVEDRSHALKPLILEPMPVLHVKQPSIAHLYPKPKRPRAKKEKRAQ